MKFGYALLCHKNPDQINFLIDNLNNNQDCFFVHIDAKAFPKDEIRHGSNIFFTKKRVFVHWGHFSQIQGLLELLKTAVEHSSQYDYLWILSGQDFPIKSRTEMLEFMKKNRGSEFTQIDHEEKNSKLKLGFYYPDILFSNIRYFFFSKSIGNVLLQIYLKMNKLLRIRRKDFELNVCKGSLWITLSRQCVEYIVEYVHNHPEYLNRFKYTLCGDEFFFNSILMNSPFKDSVKNANLRYIDWSNNEMRPQVLTIDNLKSMQQSECFFARKFDPEIDSEIISHFSGIFHENETTSESEIFHEKIRM